MSIKKDITELLNAEVITQETADKIQEYYKNKGTSSNRLVVIFGILGATLVGLGVILILAHNWDELSRATKIFYAYLPLVVGQLACVYSILKKIDNTAWKEGSATFTFFSVGATISLVSQIYNISGDLSSFILTWAFLGLPMVYVMRSSFVSLFCIIGITFYGVKVGYWTSTVHSPQLYWMYMTLMLPHYYLLYKEKPNGNFITFHHWFIALSIIIMLGSFATKMEELMFVAYFSLFGLYYLIGELNYFSHQKLRNNAYKIIGTYGTINLLMVASFEDFWDHISEKDYHLNEVVGSPEFIIAFIISLIGVGVLYFSQKGKSITQIKPLALLFLVFILTFLIGVVSPIAFVLVNIYALGIGILTVKEGAKQDSLGLINFGLLIITALIMCRFFDTDISFVIRGILFVLVGIGFFYTNYWMLKKRKTNEQ